MPYKALYRTYRPFTFEEVAGQQQIIQTLRNALTLNKLSHAYLFTGPRGTGKTTMAKLFAKALNCEQGLGKQCNSCSNCKAINDNSHPDVLEIDAASNNGVDEVRDLIEKVKYSPIKGQYKVYIIDEVHMMTSGAFNALLKTLEEPPAHVIFILATTDPHKIIPTILSRCQRYDFSKVSPSDIYVRLVDVLKKEKVTYDERALQWLINLADGGVRDALSMLDQIIAYAGNHIEEKHILDLFGLISVSNKIDLLTMIALGENEKLLTHIQGFEASGVDLKRLVDDLIQLLKDVLIFLRTQNSDLLVLLTVDEVNHLLDFIDYHVLSTLIQWMMQLQSQIKSASSVRTYIEISFLDFSQKMIEINAKSLKSKPALKKEVSIFETPKIEAKPIDFSVGEFALQGEKIAIQDDDVIQVMMTGLKDDKNALQAKWGLLDSFALDDKVGKFASVLREATPYVLSKKILIIECELPMHIDKINNVTNQSSMQTIVEQLLGRKVIVYAIHRQEAIRLKKYYLNLAQAKKLPDKQDEPIQIKNWMNP